MTRATKPTIKSKSGSRNSRSILVPKTRFIYHPSMNIPNPDEDAGHTTVPQAANASSSVLGNNPSPTTSQAPFLFAVQVFRPSGSSDTNRYVLAWFDLAPEIRREIYKALIGSKIINYDASATPTLYIHPPRAPGTPSNFGPVRGPPTNKSAWLVVTKRFFQEAREVLWEVAKFKFERRWDVINCFANQSLDADPPSDAPTGLDNISMCPVACNVFSKIRKLHVNLTDTSDFGGTVITTEARRVTITILNIIKNSMPAAKQVIFSVDQKSRLQDGFMIFLPSAWFLEKLLDMPKLKVIRFKAAGDFDGVGFRKDANQACIWALNNVFREHLRSETQEGRLMYGLTGSNVARKMQAKVGRMMLDQVRIARPRRGSLWEKLEKRCDMLEMSS